MLTSYHVHSVFSDGETDIPDLVEGANRIGLDELGISDHYVVLPDGQQCSWSMPLDDLGRYIAAIDDSSRKACSDMKVLKGLEADYIPETLDALITLLSPFTLDYIIGSVHYVDGFCIDESSETWQALEQSERNEIIRAYWARVKAMAKTGIFAIAGHIDLYKKFGYGPTIDVSGDIGDALDAIASSKMAVEINTAGLYKPASEIYPSPCIIAECRKRCISVVITADAHNPYDLTRDYDRAFSAIEDVGYDLDSLWRPHDLL